MMNRNGVFREAASVEGLAARFWAVLRQWRFPREFRIDQPIYSGELQSVVAQLLRASEESPANSPQEAAAGDGNSRFPNRVLAEVGTNLWRLRLKMLQPGNNQPREEMRRSYRHVESMWDMLAQEGVEVHDHTGEVVPEGGVYGLKVLACQPTPGIGREMVLETIRPSIRYRKQVIQMGEVILAKPDNTADEATVNALPDGGNVNGK